MSVNIFCSKIFFLEKFYRFSIEKITESKAPSSVVRLISNGSLHSVKEMGHTRIPIIRVEEANNNGKKKYNEKKLTAGILLSIKGRMNQTAISSGRVRSVVPPSKISPIC